LRNDRTFPAANFQLVTIRVFEKEGVVTRTVASANFRTLKILPASVAHKFRNPIHFSARVRPKRDSCAIRFVVSIRTKAKEFRRSVATSRIKSMEIFAWGFLMWRRFVPFANKSKLGQKFSVEFSCHFHVFHPQIDVIKATRFHFVILNWFAPQFNRL